MTNTPAGTPTARRDALLVAAAVAGYLVLAVVLFSLGNASVFGNSTPFDSFTGGQFGSSVTGAVLGGTHDLLYLGPIVILAAVLFWHRLRGRGAARG